VSVPLRGLEWTAGAGLEKDPRADRGRRTAALAAALLAVAVLGWLLGGGLFQVRQVHVAGNQRLTAAQVKRLAGLDRPGSVFGVDAATIRRKLTADAWVRDAEVTPVLPDRVDVTVDEWQPVAVLVLGSGAGYYLSDQAVVLGAAPPAASALEVDAPTAAAPRVGQRPLDPRLLTALVNIQRGLPGLVGEDVRSFEVDGCGNLTMTTARGWKAYFGRVITPEEFASLDSKLAALKAVSTAENLNSPDLDYVNLMNASLPAVGHKSRPGPTPTPAAGAHAPSPAPPPAATAPVPIVTCR
jgi:POTRA domain, FtsQ-type